MAGIGAFGYSHVMQAVFLVFFGAGIGGALRHGVNLAALRLFGPNFPYGTLGVNVIGSCVMGLLTGWLAFRSGASWSQPLRLFLTTGVLGGFTTFSSFSLDAVFLWEKGQAGASIVYVLVSFVASIAALVAGLSAMRWLG